jgi:integrase
VTRRKTLSDVGVSNLKPRPTRYAAPDPEMRGHYVRVTPSGARSFVAVARSPTGKQVWATIGSTDKFAIEEAREKARAAIKRIQNGFPPFEAPRRSPDLFEAVADKWLKRHVHAKGLRSEKEVTRLLKVHVFPAWKSRAFLSIRRSDIAELLDHIEDEHGARQADYVLAIIRGICNWFATRHDDYVPPIARGMRRTDPKNRKRRRILDDNELWQVWNAAYQSGPFGALLQLALLTAQRRDKLVSIRWDDISTEGEWGIRSSEREKGTAGALILPELALGILRAQPRLANNPYIFASRGTGHFNSFSKSKEIFDAKVRDVAPWVIHDLRRTARSLMSRAGVRPDIAERVLGHAIAGVEGVYDRHSYKVEKREALKRLADLVEKIATSVDYDQA